jgi:hypothetical protein
VPRLRHHDMLLRFIEKDLGTAEFLLGELTWDVQPYRASTITLLHAAELRPDSTVDWQQDVQLPQLRDLGVPQRDLYGLLAATYLGQYRLWGESNSVLSAEYYLQLSRTEILGESGPPRAVTRDGTFDPHAFLYNSLTDVTTELARFRGDSVVARRAVLYSDSALARRVAFEQNWPALGSLLFERGRALHTYGALTRSRAALDSSERYLNEAADYRGPERPWVFAQTRQELASLGLDRSYLEADAARRAAILKEARRNADSALQVLRTTELPPAASASLRSLDAELLAELSIAERRPALLDEAEARLHEASRVFPSTALPRDAAWVCVRQAVIARARYVSTGAAGALAAGGEALDRAQVLVQTHSDSLVMYRVRREREALARARDGGWPARAGVPGLER